MTNDLKFWIMLCIGGLGCGLAAAIIWLGVVLWRWLA
jgi:hypothetical protein